MEIKDFAKMIDGKQYGYPQFSKEELQIAKDNGFRSHNTNTCGYHIHFNRSFFEDKEDECIAKLLYLVEKFWDELVKFSRRDYENLERWQRNMIKHPMRLLKI